MNLDLDSIRRKAVAATKGVWRSIRDHDHAPPKRVFLVVGGRSQQTIARDLKPEDAAFFSVMRPEVALALIERIEKLQHMCLAGEKLGGIPIAETRRPQIRAELLEDED